MKSIAGDLYQQSIEIDSSKLDNKFGGLDVGADSLKRKLMEVELEARLHSLPTQQAPVYQQPQYAPVPSQHIQGPIPQYVAPAPVDQLEFNLDPSKQDVTNNLLKEISNKMSKHNELLTSLIDLLKSSNDVPKLKVEKSGIPKIVGQPSKAE